MNEDENDFNYPVVDKDTYKLTITIGDGQIGESSFSNFDGQDIIGEVKDVLLGAGKDIKGSSLIVDTTVTAVNKNTVHTSVTYYLNDVEVQCCSKDAAAFKATVDYTTTIHFT
jgi:hypothetical protein